MNISELNDADLQKLAVLHCSVMRSLLSDLGLPIVLKYYQTARSDLSVLGVCALDQSNTLIGWAIGSPDPAAVNAKVRQPLSWFLAQMLQLATTHPLIFKQLVSSALASTTEIERNSGVIELTYIGVSSVHQRKGLGRSLLNKFIELSRLKGYHSVVLSVEEENKTAVALYEKSGFKIIKTFTEGHYQRHRMEYILV